MSDISWLTFIDREEIRDIMRIKLFGGLRQTAGSPEFEVSGTTIKEALEDLCRDNQALREAIFDGSVLRPHVRVMVNGRDCEFSGGLETAVYENDQIAIFPPIAGG
jgi:molybdopterin synthase sulfur carrier subunit